MLLGWFPPCKGDKQWWKKKSMDITVDGAGTNSSRKSGQAAEGSTRQ